MNVLIDERFVDIDIVGTVEHVVNLTVAALVEISGTGEWNLVTVDYILAEFQFDLRLSEFGFVIVLARMKWDE